MKYRELLEACWDGYQQKGMKKKGDRRVPNCVKMSEQELEEEIKAEFLAYQHSVNNLAESYAKLAALKETSK